MSMMSFKADTSEEVEIDTYRKARHFKDRPSFLRFAVFAYIRQNKAGGHRSKDSAETPERSGRDAPPHESSQSEGQS